MAGYVGDVAIPYDQNIGQFCFEHYGYEIARRTAEEHSEMYSKLLLVRV